MTKEIEVIEGKDQIDLSKYITTTDLDSPEVIEEMKIVIKQINDVLDGAKIDRTKMLTTFNINSFCKKMPKYGSTMHMAYSDFIRYGILYGAIANSHQPDKSKINK